MLSLIKFKFTSATFNLINQNCQFFKNGMAVIDLRTTHDIKFD